MTAAASFLIDTFGRVRDGVAACLEDIPASALSYRPDPAANPIAWLIWHLSRVQDDHLADAFDQPQRWHSGGWAEKFALPFDDSATGYGQSAEEVGKIDVSAELLLGYHDAVHDATCRYLSVDDLDLERVVDENWDPPVTLGVRLISVVSDDLQHVGQAAYMRGLWERSRG